MPSKEFDIYIEHAKGVEAFFRNLREALLTVKREVTSTAPTARVYLFGSAARGRYTAASDVDVLVVLESLEGVDADAIRLRVKRAYPQVELHITDRRTFENWYKRFIPPEELVEI